MFSPYPTDEELAEDRADAETGMIDVCVIDRAGTGAPVFDEATGQYVDPPRVVVYDPGVAPHFGKCKFQTATVANAAAASVTAGERSANIEGAEIQLPVLNTGNIAVNDVVTLVSSPTDPSRADRTYTVSTRFDKTYATSRRLRLLEVTA